MIRANSDGSIVRMRDVARVSLEASSYSTESGINGKNAAILGIYMLPGANALEVAKSVRAEMAEISKNFPEGVEYNFPFDMTEYIYVGHGLLIEYADIVRFDSGYWYCGG